MPPYAIALALIAAVLLGALYAGGLGAAAKLGRRPPPVRPVRRLARRSRPRPPAEG